MDPLELITGTRRGGSDYWSLLGALDIDCYHLNVTYHEDWVISLILWIQKQSPSEIVKLWQEQNQKLIKNETQVSSYSRTVFLNP